MRLSKTILIAAILLTALALWTHGQWRLRTTQKTLAHARARETDLQEQVSAAKAHAERLQEELRKRSHQRDQAQIAAAKAERELAQAVPDSSWVKPPPVLPEWNPASPYVWLRKDIVPLLSVPAFNDVGEIRPEAAAVLNAGQGTRVRLNKRLKELLRQYEELELAGAELLDQPLPGLGSPGPSVTVRLQVPEEAARLKQAFEAELRQELGDQRADLLLQTASGWINSKFGSLGEEAKTISVARHDNGTYNIAVRFAGSWMSVGGVRELTEYVPSHLLPLFHDLGDDGL
jgi:hypothetical protein